METSHLISNGLALKLTFFENVTFSLLFDTANKAQQIFPENIGKKGIFILGSSYFSKVMEGKRANVSTLSIEKYRNLLLWLLIILTIIVIIISLYLGLFQDLIIETGG